MISDCKLGDESEMVRWGTHYEVVEDVAVVILFVEGDCKVSNYAHLVFVGFLLNLLSFVNDVVEPDCGIALVGWHGVTLVSHLFASPFAEMPFTALPNICVCLNGTVFLTSV